MQALINGDPALFLVAHQVQGQAQMNQREAGGGRGAQLMEPAQGAERRPGIPGQHIGSIGQDIEAAGSGVGIRPDPALLWLVGFAGNAADPFLQILQEKIHGLPPHPGRHLKTAFTVAVVMKLTNRMILILPVTIISAVILFQ